MRSRKILPWLLALVVMVSQAAFGADIQDLTAGVSKIVTPGSPGRLSVFGPEAFAVVMGKADDSEQPAVAAARFGSGRIVAFGHNGYFGADALKDAGTGRLFTNAVRWCGRNAEKPVVLVARDNKLLEAVKALGLDATQADLEKLPRGSVLIADGERVNSKNTDAISLFVRAGGGLITSATGWGWEQLHPGKELATDLAVNAVLIRAGLAFAGGTLSATTQGGFAVSANLPPLSNASVALAVLQASTDGKPMKKDDAALVSATLLAAVASLPPNDTAFLPKLHALTANPKIHTVPTETKPVKINNPAGRVMVGLQGNFLRRALPGQLQAHPAADTFPGGVPSTAPRLKDSVIAIDTRVPDWHSTGLYAAPGETISVTLPAAAVKKKLHVRIGAHRDQLWHLDTWKRFPEISYSRPLDQAVTPVANAFGGLIYIEVPRGCALGGVEVKIAGAVDAPFYEHGKTSVADWKASIRNHPAPWGEIVSSKVIVTLPSSVLRTLDDPKALMDVWDRILDLDAELAMIPKDRLRPERIVCDVQISAGYMHSGYPIMTWMDQPKSFASRESLEQGNWGIFHELGHNHQVRDWTFEGTGEVTCNLFSFYVFDKLCGVKPSQYVHGKGESKVIDRYQAYFAAGPGTLERWRKDPFTALCMYAQLQEAFGWEPYQKVFAAYRALPDDQRPKSDQDRRDQWMERFSKTVGRNLAPFFNKWGVTTSDKAAREVAGLPPWMPAGMK